MNLSGDSESYRAALGERRQREMEEVETWIDDTQAELYKSMGREGRRRSSFILSEECMKNISQIVRDYDLRGFRKRRIQEAMEEISAKKPFEGAMFGTLREKHNTFMNFIFAIEIRQKKKRETEMEEAQRIKEEQLELEKKIEEEKKAEEEKDERERLEAERRERERLEAEARHHRWRMECEEEEDVIILPTSEVSDLRGNPLQLSEDKRNSLCSGHFIGSIYVGPEDGESWTDRHRGEKSSSWRVRL